MPDGTMANVRDTLSAVRELWRSREDIKSFVASVRAYWKKTNEPGERPILIIGPGGTGKTTLARILSGEFSWIADLIGPYSESRGVEKTVHVGTPQVEIITAPGQTHRRQTSWQDLLKGLAGGEYRGVIFLVSAGLPSLREGDGYTSHHLYAGDKAAFLEQYRAEQLADELASLAEIAPRLRDCRERVWLLTVVAKQDLWIPRADEITRHYRSGAFADAVAQIAAGKDGRQFRAELSFASLVISNWVDVDGAVLAKNAAGYDQPQQAASLLSLFKTIAELKAWEDAA